MAAGVPSTAPSTRSARGPHEVRDHTRRNRRAAEISHRAPTVHKLVEAASPGGDLLSLDLRVRKRYKPRFHGSAASGWLLGALADLLDLAVAVAYEPGEIPPVVRFEFGARVRFKGRQHG